MPLLLTCDCGARFEVDDLLAGQDVHCPECQQVLKTSPTGQAEPRTSLLALLSLVLALAGGFTLVGSAAAVCLGLVALLHISRHRDRLAGSGFAVAGIALGLAFTAATGLLLWQSHRLPLAGWLRQRMLAGQIDATATWPASSADGVCVLPRPSDDWVLLRRNRSSDGAVDDLQKNREALLTHLRRQAYIDIGRDPNPFDRNQFEEGLREALSARPPLIGDDEDERQQRFFARPATDRQSDLPPVDGFVGREWRLRIERGGQSWRFIVRAWWKEKPDGKRHSGVYVVRAYAPQRYFEDLEAELTAALDNVRFPP